MNAYPEDTELVRGLVAYAGTTPAGVARQAGVAVSTVNRPFNGSATNRLGRAVLEKLRLAFPDYPGWAADIADSAVSSAYTLEELGWLELLRNVDPDIRDALLRVARITTTRETEATVHEKPASLWKHKWEQERGPSGERRDAHRRAKGPE